MYIARVRGRFPASAEEACLTPCGHPATQSSYSSSSHPPIHSSIDSSSQIRASLDVTRADQNNGNQDDWSDEQGKDHLKKNDDEINGNTCNTGDSQKDYVQPQKPSGLSRPFLVRVPFQALDVRKGVYGVPLPRPSQRPSQPLLPRTIQRPSQREGEKQEGQEQEHDAELCRLSHDEKDELTEEEEEDDTTSEMFNIIKPNEDLSIVVPCNQCGFRMCDDDTVTNYHTNMSNTNTTTSTSSSTSSPASSSSSSPTSSRLPQDSLSVFRLLHYDGLTSLVECRPLTGRTHQLRAHLWWLGHPIANDPCYGGDGLVSNMLDVHRVMADVHRVMRTTVTGVESSTAASAYDATSTNDVARCSDIGSCSDVASVTNAAPSASSAPTLSSSSASTLPSSSAPTLPSPSPSHSSPDVIGVLDPLCPTCANVRSILNNNDSNNNTSNNNTSNSNTDIDNTINSNSSTDIDNTINSNSNTDIDDSHRSGGRNSNSSPIRVNRLPRHQCLSIWLHAWKLYLPSFCMQERQQGDDGDGARYTAKKQRRGDDNDRRGGDNGRRDGGGGGGGGGDGDGRHNVDDQSLAFVVSSSTSTPTSASTSTSTSTPTSTSTSTSASTEALAVQSSAVKIKGRGVTVVTAPLPTWALPTFNSHAALAQDNVVSPARRYPWPRDDLNEEGKGEGGDDDAGGVEAE